ncbi:MAG: thiamine pyrophosphate-dependent enzyme [Gammaproteobacteria bacterium]
MPALTTGQIIVDSLVCNGVDTLFGIPGAHTYDFFDALYEKRDKLRVINTRHEQGAGYMAYGYARSSGRVGVYSVVPGPGVLNSGAALATAYGANEPVLCITGEIFANEIGRCHGILHELPDQLGTLKLLTKWAARINHPRDAPAIMAEAFQQLSNGRIRPVAVETPWDVFGRSATVDRVAPTKVLPPPEPDPEGITQAVSLLKKARNPMVMVGTGAREAGEEVLELAEILQAPVVAHRGGRGIVGEHLPYGFSCAAGYRQWLSTDLVVGIGTRMELAYIRWQSGPKAFKVIRIDIDPGEMTRRQSDAAIVTDAKVGTRLLVDALRKVMRSRESREAEFKETKSKLWRDIQVVQPQMSYLDEIRKVLPNDGFFVEEIAQIGFTARYGFPVYEPRTYVNAGYQDSLGFGYNTALGVKIANPDKSVVSVNGDGGFMFGVQELATAVHHKINVVAVVFNNRGFGNVLRDQETRFHGRLIGHDLTNPSFVKLAESFGIAAYLAPTPEIFRKALEQAFAEDAPALIEVPIEPGAESSPWPFLTPDGRNIDKLDS